MFASANSGKDHNDPGLVMAGFTIKVNSTTIVTSGGTNALKIYNCLVNVIRVTKTNVGGIAGESENTIHTNIPCTIKWKSGGEKILFNKETHYLDAVLRCRKVDITTNDKIVYNSKTYEIVDLYDDNNLGKLLVIALRKIG